MSFKRELADLMDYTRKYHPEMSGWSDEEVLEALLLRLTVEKPGEFSVSGRGTDGKPIFKIEPRYQ